MKETLGFASAPVPPAQTELSIVASRALVCLAETNEELFARGADLRGPVASTQKLLTALVVWRGGSLEKHVTILEEDLDCMPYHLGLCAGEKATRLELLHALLLASSNDVAMALARDIAGNAEAFAERMNLEARSCGMLDSHFVNPHGLPDERQYSTARDVIRLARAVDQIPVLRSIVKAREHCLMRGDGSSIRLTNRNRLLQEFPGCDGVKTGFTKAAGYCLVASAGRGAARRLAVVLNSTESAVWQDARSLLSWRF